MSGICVAKTQGQEKKKGGQLLTNSSLKNGGVT